MYREDEDYGTKIPYDPLWKGPMETQRTPTDFKFLKFFGIFCAIWIGIGIYATLVGDLNHVNPNSYPSGNSAKSLNKRYADYFDLTMYHKPSSSHIDAVRATTGIIAMCTVLAGSLAILYIVLLRWFAKTIVWTAIVSFCLVLLLIIFALLTMSSQSNSSDSDSAKWSAFGLGILLTIVIIIVVLCRKKIDIACEVIREACKAVLCFTSLLAVPVPTFILSTVVLSYFVFVLAYLLTIVDAQKGAPFHVQIFHLYNIFGIIWMWNFIQGAAQMVMCGSFATWFWTMDKNNVPRNAVSKSASNTARYHLGTVALGAMIITICQIIDYILQKIKNRLKSGSICCCCFGLCFYNCYTAIFGRLERLVRFINTNALIMSSVHGTDFFTSAKQAFNLIMRNIVKTYITNKVTKGIIFLGKLLIIIISGLIAYGLMDKDDPNVMQIQWVAPVCTMFIAAVISTCFFKVLETAIDTVFLCALEDYERNDGTQDKPYYMSHELKQMMLSDERGF